MTGPAVCRTREEITTHLLLLSARVSDEQKRPLADANCRGVERGVWGWGGVGGERKNVKREKKEEGESAGREVAAGGERIEGGGMGRMG